MHGQVHVERVELEQHGAKRGEEGVQVEREAYDVQRRPARLVAAQVERDQGEQAAQQEGLCGRGQALAERPVLPPEAVSWSSTAANRSLAAVALSQPNCDLTELYMRHQRVSSAVDASMANTAARGARLMRRAKQRP